MQARSIPSTSLGIKLRPTKRIAGQLMPSQLLIKLAAIAIAVILCVALVEGWRADRRDRAQLNAELAATKQLLAAADERQHDRDAQLAQTLAELAAEKRTVLTPAQIVRDLPNEIPLPAPITLRAWLGAAAPGAASDAPPNGFCLARPRALLPQRSRTSEPPLRTWRVPGV